MLPPRSSTRSLSKLSFFEVNQVENTIIIIIIIKDADMILLVLLMDPGFKLNVKIVTTQDGPITSIKENNN